MNIPTAEDFISSMESEYCQGAVYGETMYTYREVEKGLNEFARRHAERIDWKIQEWANLIKEGYSEQALKEMNTYLEDKYPAEVID